MSIRKTSLSIAAALLGLAATGPMARAAYVENLQEVGSDVVATGSGTINTSGLGSPGFGGEAGGYLNPSQSFVLVGGPTGGGETAIYNTSITGPSSFGSGGGIAGTTSSGDPVGLFYPDQINVPLGYVSGDPLSSTSTFAGETLSSLGVTPGTYTWSWGDGSTADSFTLVDTAAVPEPASLGLIGVGCLSLLARRRRA